MMSISSGVLFSSSDSLHIRFLESSSVTQYIGFPSLRLHSNPEPKTVTKEVVKYIEKPVYIEKIKEVKVMDYTSLGFIAAVMIICIITVKVIIPRLTLKNVMRGFFRLIFWPIKKAWEAAKKDAAEVMEEESKRE